MEELYRLLAGLRQQVGTMREQLDKIAATDVAPLANYSAAAAPGVGDDANDGYSVGSVWINTTADDAYICLDSTAGAAVWKKTTP